MKSKKLLLFGVLITGCEQSPQSTGPNVSYVPIVASLAKEDQGDSYENRQSTLLGVEAAILPSPSLSAPGDIIAYSVRSDFDGQRHIWTRRACRDATRKTSTVTD